MNDKEKFIAEWKTRFPSEELPDAGFLASVNFMNIRSKILESESTIKQLRLALEKEEYILNWLISLDIEISVSGNVGIVVDSTTSGPNPTPIWTEGERSSNCTEPDIDQTKEADIEKSSHIVLIKSDSQGKMEAEKPDSSMRKQDFVQAQDCAENDARSTLEENTAIEVNGKPPTSAALLSDTGRVNRPLDLSLGAVTENVETPDEPEYENVLDLLVNHPPTLEAQDSVESPTRKGKDKRRAGGSWSLYIEGKSTESEKIESKSNMGSDIIYESISINHHEKENNPVSVKAEGQKGIAKINVYEEIPFLNESEDETDLKNDNVTINELYETVPVFKRDSINTEEKERDGEAIYVNVQDFSIPRRSMLEASDASDCDSDGGKSYEKSHSYRHMTEDEINKLRKWRSDEDLSQLNQDFGMNYCIISFHI